MPDFTISPTDLMPEKRDSPACSQLSANIPSSCYFALGPIPWKDLLPAHLLGCHQLLMSPLAALGRMTERIEDEWRGVPQALSPVPHAQTAL